jgi:hypothetical protein
VNMATLNAGLGSAAAAVGKRWAIMNGRTNS